MIKLNWEEVLLTVLFSAILGAMIQQEKWWPAAASAVWVAVILAAGYRRPQGSEEANG